MTYKDLAANARPEAVADLAHALLLIYEADRVPGITNGEAVLCRAYSSQARDALTKAGVLPIAGDGHV